MIKRTPNTFVIGAGPVATALSGALRLAGVPVLGLWARSAAAARAAGAAAGVAAYSVAPPDLLLEADVVVLAVRDDAIGAIARMLVRSGLVNRHHVLLHCSGALSAEEALGGVREEVGGVATLHPLRAMPDGRAAMRALRGTVFGIEGDDAGRAAAERLVTALGGKPLELAGDDMAAYHAAATITSNYLIVLIDVAADLFAQIGIEPPAALDALLPLVESTLANVRERGTTAALTGPIRRGDAAAVSRHVDILAERPALLDIYRALGHRAVELARKAGTPEPKLAQILAQLDRPAGRAGSKARAASPP